MPRKGQSRYFTTEQDRRNLAEYAAGQTTVALAAFWGVDPGTIARSVCRAGGTLRTRPEYTRRYELDESYFSTISTPAQARWLGFIAADGCVTGRQELPPQVLCIGLSAVDAAHLYALRDALGYAGPVLTRTRKPGNKGGDIARLDVRSGPLCQALGAQGVLPRKSMTMKPWDGPTHLMRHFWAGMVDGDGWVVRTRGPTAHGWEVGLTGSLACIEAFREFVHGETGDLKPVRRNHSIYLVTYTRLATAQSLCRLFYTNHDGAIPLARKQLMAEQAMACKLTRTRRHFTAPELLGLFAEHRNWYRVAEVLGLRPGNLWKIRTALGIERPGGRRRYATRPKPTPLPLA